jgi:hypothetical protein
MRGRFDGLWKVARRNNDVNISCRGGLSSLVD